MKIKKKKNLRGVGGGLGGGGGQGGCEWRSEAFVMGGGGVGLGGGVQVGGGFGLGGGRVDVYGEVKLL